MSHGDYLRRPGTWPAGTVPEASDFQKLDVAQARALNGDDGGTWNPINPICIGGAGGGFAGLGCTLNGGVTTKRGGRLVLGANDFPVLSPSRSRTVTWHLWEQQTNFPPTWADNRIAFYTGDNAFGINPGNGNNEIAIPPKFLHKGAQLSSLSIRFRLPRQPSVAEMANAHLIVVPDVTAATGSFTGSGFPNGDFSTIGQSYPAVWSAGSARSLNFYTAPAASPNGFYYKATSISGTGTTGATEPTWPTTVGATVTDNPGANQIVWTCIGLAGVGTHAQLTVPETLYANGAVQSLTFQSDPAANNAVDPGTYYYGLTYEIGPFSILHSVQFTFTGITSLAFQ